MFHLLLAIIYISFISLGLPDSLLGSAWPSMYPGLQVPISYAGMISMTIAGCTIISSLFSDRLVRKFGTGGITIASVAMTAAALFGFSVSDSFWLLCFWAIPYGLGAGSVDAALNNFVALHYKAKHMSWLHCFWGVGATLGPYIMGMCLTGGLGWSSGYRYISYLQIVLTFCLFLSLPLWRRQGNEAEENHMASEPLSGKHLLRLPGAKQILVAFFCYCALESVTGLWGSSYMVMRRGITPERAAGLISLFYFGITGGRFISGFLTIGLSDKNMIRLGQALAVAGIALVFGSPSVAVMSLGFIFIGLGCAPIYPCLLHQTPDRFGKQVSQSMMGMQMACAYVGSTFAPLLTGFVVERLGTMFFPLFLLLFAGLMGLMVEVCNRSSSMKGEKK